MKINDHVRIKQTAYVPEKADIYIKSQLGESGRVMKIHAYTDGNWVRVETKLKGKFWWHEEDLELVEWKY